MKHKIAILSDVHGNVTALQEVVNDVKKEGCTESWYMGDLIMPGSGTDDLLSLLKEINTTTYVLGNWDSYLFESDEPDRYEDPQYVYFSTLIDYVKQNMDTEGIDFIRSWPMQVVKHVGPLTISLSHNLPDKNYGHDLRPMNNTENFEELFTADDSIDIAIVGHTHRQFMRPTTGGQIVLNPGAIGQPFSDRAKLFSDLRSRYLILEIDETGLADVDFRRVQYDRHAEFELAKTRKLPYIELYEKQMDTGITYTHDRDVLKELNDKHGYSSFE